jgi:hypothetical protein
LLKNEAVVENTCVIAAPPAPAAAAAVGFGAGGGLLVAGGARYDAVTVKGDLRWQNSLTPLNAPFFDLADALFVNYNWTPARLPSAGDC